MFKDTKEGETHSYNDGCGEPAHNPKLPQHIEEKFDKELNWKDCGNFKFEDYTIRPCVICGVDTRLCVNCSTDHHLGNRDVAIKSFIATILNEERRKFVQEVEDVRSQYEHEVHGLNSVDSFNHALDYVIQAINLIREDEV